MIYLFGNCQMEFLGRALDGLGVGCEHRPLATPLGPLSSGGVIPPELLFWSQQFDLGDYLHGRTLKNQFQAISADDPAPSLFVVNLFHENEPLFVHESGYLFFADPAAWSASPGFEAWMKTKFKQIKLPKMDYLNRFAQFVAALRQGYPTTPIIIATQLSHYPAFAPDPYSYLSCWEHVWHEAGVFVQALADEIGGCHVLDADRVFAGVWNRSQGNVSDMNDMDDHCPFLKVSIGGDGNGAQPIMRRDLEHIGTLWPAMAAKVASFLGSGKLTFSKHETVPTAWSEDYAPRPLSRSRLRKLLGSGGNYDGARVVNAMLNDMGHNHAGLLAECAENMAVCHGTLHMVHCYAMLNPAPALMQWCEVQKEKIGLFTQNGQQYQRRYIERLDEIVSSVLMHSVARNIGTNPGLTANPPVC